MPDDIQLVKKAQKGDKKAFEELVMKYDRLVLNIAYAYRNDNDDADDIYQEVFIRVFRGLNNFQARSKFSTWLYRIAVNVCIEFKRKAKVHSHESLSNNSDDEDNGHIAFESVLDSGMETDKTALNNELNRFIKNEVNKLPQQLKMAFTLKYYQGLKIKEISSMMHCTEGTIKSYLFTSSRKLRERLKPILEV
jgi:RNA polymerase sigma-70 factor (ECF subfamily)